MRYQNYKKYILVTAWNDSGAGYLMRLLDNSSNLNIFPFETLLGIGSNVGIQPKADLIRPSNRWNIFRDINQVLNYIKVNRKKIIFESQTYRGIRNIFDENELFDWLENRKFHKIEEYRPKICNAILKFLKKYPIENIENESQLLEYNLNYIDTLFLAFFEKNSEFSRVIHCPSMAMDTLNSNFKKFFHKVVIVVIDPQWGFGNMHLRNKITFNRYLERWYQVNISSFNYLKQNSNSICIVTSKETKTNYINARKVLDFLESPLINKNNLHPSLLGDTKDCIGYPYGGITSFKKKEIDSAYTISSNYLINNDCSLFEKCNNLYNDLKKISIG